MLTGLANFDFKKCRLLAALEVLRGQQRLVEEYALYIQDNTPVQRSQPVPQVELPISILQAVEHLPPVKDERFRSSRRDRDETVKLHSPRTRDAVEISPQQRRISPRPKEESPVVKEQSYQLTPRAKEKSPRNSPRSRYSVEQSKKREPPRKDAVSQTPVTVPRIQTRDISAEKVREETKTKGRGRGGKEIEKRVSPQIEVKAAPRKEERAGAVSQKIREIEAREAGIPVETKISEKPKTSDVPVKEEPEIGKLSFPGTDVCIASTPEFGDATIVEPEGVEAPSSVNAFEEPSSVNAPEAPLKSEAPEALSKSEAPEARSKSEAPKAPPKVTPAKPEAVPKILPSKARAPPKISTEHSPQGEARKPRSRSPNVWTDRDVSQEVLLSPCSVRECRKMKRDTSNEETKKVQKILTARPAKTDILAERGKAHVAAIHSAPWRDSRKLVPQRQAAPVSPKSPRKPFRRKDGGKEVPRPAKTSSLKGPETKQVLGSDAAQKKDEGAALKEEENKEKGEVGKTEHIEPKNVAAAKTEEPHGGSPQKTELEAVPKEPVTPKANEPLSPKTPPPRKEGVHATAPDSDEREKSPTQMDQKEEVAETKEESADIDRTDVGEELEKTEPKGSAAECVEEKVLVSAERESTGEETEQVEFAEGVRKEGIHSAAPVCEVLERGEEEKQGDGEQVKDVVREEAEKSVEGEKEGGVAEGEKALENADPREDKQGELDPGEPGVEKVSEIAEPRGVEPIELGSKEAEKPAEEGDKQAEKPAEEGGKQDEKSAEEGGKHDEKPAEEGGKQDEKPAEEGGKPAEEGEKLAEKPAEEGGKEAEKPAKESEKQAEKPAEESGEQADKSAEEGEKQVENPAEEGEKEAEKTGEEGGKPAEEGEKQAEKSAEEGGKPTEEDAKPPKDSDEVGGES